MALEQKKDVEELADQLSAIADQAQSRVLAAIKQGKINPEDARTAFDDVVLLRQHANRMYIETTLAIVDDLKISQSELTQTIVEAGVALMKFERVASVMTLLTDFVKLAAAASAGQSKATLNEFKKLRQDIQELARLDAQIAGRGGAPTQQA